MWVERVVGVWDRQILIPAPPRMTPVPSALASPSQSVVLNPELIRNIGEDAEPPTVENRDRCRGHQRRFTH